MRTNEFHKSFIQSLIIVAIVTMFAMVSSRYMVEYYFNTITPPVKTLEYSSQKSYETTNSRVNNWFTTKFTAKSKYFYLLSLPVF